MSRLLLVALLFATPVLAAEEATPPADAATVQPSPQTAAVTPAARKPKPAPEGAKLRIIWPRNGAVVKGGFWLRMGLSGMGVAPAKVEWPDTGHHHVLVDVDMVPAPGEPIPNDRNHLHFGGGQTEARIELPPGKHTLQLVLGDDDHRVFDPPIVSPKITITVR